MGGEIFHRPWAPPSLLYNGYWFFPGGKVRPGRAADHSPPSTAEVMEEYSYTSTHPLGHNRVCNGATLPFTMKIKLFWDTRQSAGYFDIIFSYSVSFWVYVFYDASCFVCCLPYHSMLRFLRKQSRNQLTKISRMQTCSYT